MNKIILLLLVFLVGCGGDGGDPIPSPPDATKFLEIHTINVQQGDSTLVIGPNGTTVLIDGGDTGQGTDTIVPYLKRLGIENSLDYILNTHRHEDHLGGLDEVMKAGYDVKNEIWANGSTTITTVANTNFMAAATSTTAKSVKTVSLGESIALGNGAKATVVAVSGNILGTTTPFTATNENDKSVALLIQYGLFDYMMTGDLGGGESTEDRNCTGRSTGQENMESILVQAIMPGGAVSLLTATGVDALMVPHHGSESSMNRDYMNGMSPSIAIIGVGDGQGANFEHPRKDIVEKVLMAGAGKPCITAPPALVLQTDEGSPIPIGANASTAGHVVGDVVIKTNGVSTFQVSGSGRIRSGSPDERVGAGIAPPKSFPLD